MFASALHPLDLVQPDGTGPIVGALALQMSSLVLHRQLMSASDTFSLSNQSKEHILKQWSSRRSKVLVEDWMPQTRHASFRISIVACVWRCHDACETVCTAFFSKCPL